METAIAINISIAVATYLQTLQFRVAGGYALPCNSTTYNPTECNIGTVNAVFFFSVGMSLFSLITLLMIKKVPLKKNYVEILDVISFISVVIALMTSASQMSDIVGSAANSKSPVSDAAVRVLLSANFNDFVERLMVTVGMLGGYVLLVIALLAGKNFKFFSCIMEPVTNRRRESAMQTSVVASGAT